jgi:nucleoside phosphorylase
MESEALFFEHDEAVFAEETAILLPIFSEDAALSGSPTRIHKPEGRVCFNPDVCSPLFIAAEERFYAPFKVVDRTLWDLYLVYLPFSLDRAAGNSTYVWVKFCVSLEDQHARAFELLPASVHTAVDRSKTYDLSPHLKLTFPDLQPSIAAIGEGERDFYWLYEKAPGEQAVAPGGRQAVVILLVPRGMPSIKGKISYELQIAKSFGRKVFLDEGKTISWPFEWQLQGAQPLYMADTISNRTAVILTTDKEEYLIVRALLVGTQEQAHTSGTIYEQGTLLTDGTPWQVVLLETSDEATSIAVEAERAIQLFKPSTVLFLGTARGIKKVQPGDVLVAHKVYNYEPGLVDDFFKTQPGVYNSTWRMQNRAKAERRKCDWLKRLPGPSATTEATVHIGPLATGEKVIATTSSQPFQYIDTHFNDALALQIGSYGLLQAARSNQQVESLVVCGISVMVGEEETAQTRQLAAQRASAFMLEVLAKL